MLLAIRDSNYVARTFRTHNGGESWEELYNELNENEVRVSDLVFDPVNDKMYLLFSGHVLESVDRGSSWVPIYWSERYNDDKWVAPGPSINKFALNSYDSKEIWGIGYGVTGQGVMIRSMDSGKNWTHYNLDTGVVGGGPLRDVSFSKTNGKAMVGFLGGIFTITDPNGDWELVYDSLGTLVLENGNVTDNTVYASGKTFGIENHGKLFITFTPDFGMNWQRFYYQSVFSEALEVNEMAVARVNNKETVLLATTKGLYSFTVTVIEPVE